MKRAILLMLAVMFIAISTSGCNAMQGVGTDIKNTGKHIENAGK